ncbi:MAG TPA: DUF2121 domain-containing protein [Methanolinea sp.]|nr:DUF2121 domain-containing protein [Methanolinea sp.]HQK54907.1 DUF2121 domain-containing protein [Methanolinea sp.]
MSLVMAFSGMSGAVMAGDQREIFFQGDESRIGILEAELNSNLLRDDEQLRSRAKDLGIAIAIRDDKCKVTSRDGVLVGEVTETDGPVIKRRRLCVSCGKYAIIEKTGPEWTVLSRGEGSHFLVLGNEATKAIAYTCIRKLWNPRGGTREDAVKVLILSMQEAAKRTASVSSAFSIIQTQTRADVPGASCL